jgi:NADPH:quinone reductase-like Zn-dependent oxidoreductase
VFIETGSIAEQVKEVCGGGVDKVLELVGTTTLSVIAVLVLAQKLLLARAAIDVPLALAIVGLGS